MFEVIPAIDLLNGKCVRLFQGRYDAETVYSNSPVEIAKQWESLGAQRIHVIDLDGARLGKAANIKIIKDIINNVRVPIQVGGGIRSIADVEEMLGMGVNRVIMGTTAIINSEHLKEICSKFGSQVIISIDVIDNKVASEGWEKVSSLEPLLFIKATMELGVKRFIYTDIRRDGTLQGPNIPNIKMIATTSSVPLYVAGGIARKEHVLAIKELNKFGVEGCIIGRALYTGDIKLKDVL